MVQARDDDDDAYYVIACRDLGAHIDGFSAVVAHTLVVGASKVRLLRSLFISICLGILWNELYFYILILAMGLVVYEFILVLFDVYCCVMV